MKVTTTVPTGTGPARFTTVDRAVPTTARLVVLVVRAGANPPVDVGAADGSDGQVDLPGVSADDLSVDRYFLPARQSAPDTPPSTRAPGRGPAGDRAVEPVRQAVTAGVASLVAASWSGPDAGERHLGRAVGGDGEHAPGTTVVRVGA